MMNKTVEILATVLQTNNLELAVNPDNHEDLVTVPARSSASRGLVKVGVCEALDRFFPTDIILAITNTLRARNK